MVWCGVLWYVVCGVLCGVVCVICCVWCGVWCGSSKRLEGEVNYKTRHNLLF